jgi:protocatechuate 3,4-dioxygenase beta subunit
MNRRLLVLLFAVAVVALPLLLLRLLDTRADDASPDGGPVPGSEGGMRQAAELPVTAAAEVGLLAPDGGEPASERGTARPTDAELLASYAHRTLPGRVTIADGGRVPEDLTVAVALQRPQPLLVALGDEIRDRGDRSPFELIPPPAAREPDGAGDGDGDGAADAASVVDAAAAATAADAADAATAAEGTEGAGASEDGARRVPSWRLAELTRVKVAADGSFELRHVPVDGAWLLVEHDWLFPDPALRIESHTTFLEARLLRGAIVEGRVVDEAGRPAERARLSGSGRFDPWMTFDPGARMPLLDSTSTDEQGRYRLAPVPAGHALTIGAVPRDERLQPGAAELAPLQPGELRELDIVLRRGGSLSGRVVDARGAGLADVGVLVQRLDFSMRELRFNDPGRRREERVRTDVAGTFRVEGLSDGSYRAALAEDGYRPVKSETQKVRAGQEAGGIELVADEGLGIDGRVLTEAGAPVPGAQLTAGRAPGMFDMTQAVDQALRREARSDEEGRFRIAGLEPGSLRVEARAEGMLTATVTAAAGATDVLLQLQPTVSLSGIVVSTRDSEPVSDFRIALLPAGGAFNFADPAAWEERFAGTRGNEVFKDRADGTFTITGVRPGDYDLQVQAAGFGRVELKALEIPKTGRRGQVVMLPPEARAVGRVVAAATGLPVDNAQVSITTSGMMEMMMDGMLGNAPRASTDADGRFTLGKLGPGPLALTVKHNAYRELGLPERILAAGEQLELGEIRLSAGSAVYGKVEDEHGRPVSGVTVLVSNATGTTMKRAPSGADGSYRVQGLPPGTFNVMRTDFTMDMGGDAGPMDFMKDMVMRSVSLGEDDEQEVDLRVRGKGGTRVFGTVRGEAGTTTGAMVSLVPVNGGLERMAFGTTGKDGVYELSGVQPGEYVLQVVVFDDGAMGAGGQPTSPVREPLAVAGEPELRRDIRLPGGVLHGRVESAADDALLPDVRILLHRRDEGRVSMGLFAAMDDRVGEAVSKADGTFRFRHLPAGTYEISAGGQNLLGTGETGYAMTRVPDLTVAEDGPGFAVRVALRPAGAVAGTVKDSSGRPLFGVSLWALGPDGAWLASFSEVSSDAGGRYELLSLEPGAWTLAFRDGSHALTLVRDVLVRAGETTALDVTLPPGVSLRLAGAGAAPWKLQISLLGPDGPVPTHLAALTELLAPADESGMLVVGTFLPGSYQLRVTAEGAVLHDGPIVLSPGQDQHLVTLGDP